MTYINFSKFKLVTQQDRLQYAQVYENFVVDWMNIYFKENKINNNEYSFKCNNHHNKYAIDIEIFKNGIHHGFLELKGVDPNNPNNRPFYSYKNGTGSDKNLFYQEFKKWRNDNRIWYGVFCPNKTPYNIFSLSI